jgi:hypothetical protein
MEQEIARFINDLKAQEQARQDTLAHQHHQREIKRKAFDQLRLEHIDEVSVSSKSPKKDIFYLIFWPTRYYSSDDIDKNNIIYKAAYDFYSSEPLTSLTKNGEFDYCHKDNWDEVVNWNHYSVRYWTFLEKICPDFLRSRMERLKN